MIPSFHKDEGAFAAAYGWQDAEGFHITIEIWSNGSKMAIPQKLAATWEHARAIVDRDTAKFGFASGECHLIVEKVRVQGT